MAVHRQCGSIWKFVLLQNKMTTICMESSCNIHRWVAPTLIELKRRRDKIGPDPDRPRSSYLDWNYSAELHAFQNRLNEKFDSTLLHKALTHKTYAPAEGSDEISCGDNASLIQDGEHFIVNYVKEYISEVFPKFPQEGVTAVCNHLVSEESLSDAAKHIGLTDITLSSEFPISRHLLAMTFKSVVAALLQSSGEHRAGEFVRDFIITQLNGKDVNEMWQVTEPLQMLKCLLGEQGMSQPEPRLCNESAKNTILAAFQVGLYCDRSVLVGMGWGENIDTAIEMAARDGLERIFNTANSAQALRFGPVTTGVTNHDSMKTVIQ